MKRKKDICKHCNRFVRVVDSVVFNGNTHEKTHAWVCMKSDNKRERNLNIQKVEEMEGLPVPDRCDMMMEYMVMEQKL